MTTIRRPDALRDTLAKRENNHYERRRNRLQTEANVIPYQQAGKRIGQTGWQSASSDENSQTFCYQTTHLLLLTPVGVSCFNATHEF